MALNAYIPQDTGNLKHVAEAEDAGPDQLSDFIEAVQETLSGRSKDGPFVVIDIDNGFSAYVEFTDEEIVETRRVMKVGGVVVQNGSGPAAAEEPEVTPAPRRRGRPKGSTRKTAAKSGSTKRAVKRSPAAVGAAEGKKTIKRGGSGFKRNPASEE
jgi:hypothetical protein